MSDPVTVSPEFLQKVVGLSEATNALLKEAEEGRTALREAATEAVDALEKAGQLQEGTDKAKLVEGFVKNPEMALKLATSVTNEAVEKAAAGTPAADAGGAAGGTPGEGEPAVSIGSVGESEDLTKRAAETNAGPVMPANMSAPKESDEVWNKGFGLT